MGKIKTYKDNGFQMVIQGKVNIAGRSPEPDILFIPSVTSNGQLIMDFTKVEYPDIKYLWDVNFTSAQKKITSNLPANVIVANSRPFALIKNGDEVLIEAGESLTITRVFKLAPTEDMILDLIPQL